MKTFKFAVPTKSVLVDEFARKNAIKPATARYHLERMLQAGVLSKEIEMFEEERSYYNPMHTHTFVHKAVYYPV